jgi:hypothetical protein
VSKPVAASVTAVTAPDSASDPAHPDHDRWVKQYTLAMEMEHAKLIGGTARDAEIENLRLLTRMENIARAARPRAPNAPRKSRQQRALERAVKVREAMPSRDPGLLWLKSSPCGRCGVCRACMRERRILAISQLVKQRDEWALAVMWRLSLFMLKANGGAGEFAGLSKSDINRRVTAEAERVCDESVKRMGAWVR